MQGRVSGTSSIADQLACLAHEVRLEIIVSLAESPKDVSTLAAELELEVNVISHHLSLLRARGFLEFQALKQRHIYSLTSGVSACARGGVLHLAVDNGNGQHFAFQRSLDERLSPAAAPR